MTTETIKQITEISTELKNLHGDDYGEQFCNRALYLITNNTVNKTDYQIIFEAVYSLIDSDYKDRLIFNLQKKIKEQDARIKYLEEENKTLKQEIKELKIENQNLNKKVDILMRNHNIVILAESIKTIQYYIIQRATGFDDARMKDVNLNLDEFINNPLNTQYKLEIEKLQEHFEISKYQSVINKIINKRNRLAHPNPIEMDELKQACDDMKTVYSGIDAIYNHYQEVYDYFNC